MTGPSDKIFPRLAPRPELSAVVPGIHGGTKSSELAPYGLTEADIIDFSASVSPFGVPVAVREAISSVGLEAYPDPEAPTLIQAISVLTALPQDRVIATSGSVELLQLVAQAYLSPRTKMLYLTPAFGEYAPVAQVMGAPTEGYPLAPGNPGTGFSLDQGDFVKWVAARTPALLVLNDPHNPTGLSFGPDLLDKLLAIDGELLIMVDEAYRDFQRNPIDLRPSLDSRRLILMRSLTKSYAMAGLRIGYGLSDSSIISDLSRVRLPWTLNSLAQAAAVAALKETEWHKVTVERVLAEKDFLSAGFTNLGLDPLPSDANFFLLEVPDEWGGARRLRTDLLSQGFRLRTCESFGLLNHLRVSPRTRKDNESLLAACSQLLPSSK